MSEAYFLRQREYWSGYGGIPIHGYAGCRTSEGNLALCRTGPFLPPMTLLNSDVLVSTEFRDELIHSGLGEFNFRPVDLVRVVELNWHLWDRTLENPPEFPDGDQLEDYIDAKPESEMARRAIGSVWEIESAIEGFYTFAKGVRPDDDGYLALCDSDHARHHMFRAILHDSQWPGTERTIVDDVAVRWLESRVGEWITFRRCATR